jgi:hypothetical protein
VKPIASLSKNRQSIDSESGLVSDFEEDQPTSRFGYGWGILTDIRVGGKSTAELMILPNGANNSRGSLSITGELISGGQDLFAGAVFYPGKAPFVPADLSAKKEISFWAKGDRGIYQIRLYSVSTGGTPETKTFSAGPEWTQFSFPISSFNRINGRDLVAILIGAAERLSKFSFQIDDLQFK